MTYYARAASAPTAPSNTSTWNYAGTSTWSRTDPGSTTTQDVYQVIRTRTYTAGDSRTDSTRFTSARWGSVTLHEDRGLPDVIAPTVTVDAPASVNAGATFNATASAPGTTWDGATQYAWGVTNGTIVSGGSSRTVTVRAGSAGTCTVRCTVTVNGVGVRYRNGSQASASGSDSVTVAAVMPDASVSVSISGGGGTESERTRVTLTAIVSGSYDTISYQWYVSGRAVSGATGRTYSFTGPSVSGANLNISYRCDVRVTGTGTNAAAGTSASDSDSTTIGWTDDD
ncbi:MAG: hypothetical protein OXH50_13335 [Gemmatimonadetes bacterium]|nr:hypothetical protein [Gemmatimonadota bacterium]